MKLFTSVVITILVVINYSSAKPTRSLGQSKFPVYIKVLNEDSLKYGSVFSAECTAESNEITDIKWVRESFKNRAYFSQFDNKIMMTISSIIPMDFGRYTCIATRSDGIQVSNSIRIERNPNYGNRFRYRLDTERQSTGTSEQLKSEELKQDKNKPEDTKGKEQQKEHEEYEQNLVGAVSDQTDVRIAQDFQTYTHEGEMVTFNCLINNEAVSDIAWTRNHGFMPPNHKVIDNTLIIYNITASDTGYYICSYKDKSTYVYLGLVRRGHPITHVKIPSMTKQINVVEGDSVEIDCKVVGELDTDLRWEKHLSVLPDNAAVENNKLKISNVQIANYGYYECLGQNILGNFSDFIYLDVKNKTELLAREKIAKGRQQQQEEDSTHVEPIENDTTPQIGIAVTTTTVADAPAENDADSDVEDPTGNDAEETGETPEPVDESETTLDAAEVDETQPASENNNADGEITNEATETNEEVEIEAQEKPEEKPETTQQVTESVPVTEEASAPEETPEVAVQQTEEVQVATTGAAANPAEPEAPEQAPAQLPSTEVVPTESVAEPTEAAAEPTEAAADPESPLPNNENSEEDTPVVTETPAEPLAEESSPAEPLAENESPAVTEVPAEAEEPAPVPEDVPEASE